MLTILALGLGCGQPTRRPSIVLITTGLEWKYFYHTEKPDALFHLADDLNENRDVIDEYPEVVEALREETLRLVHEHQRRGEGFEIKREASPELLDALRGLGYVQ
jgi:hypothetical protein